MCMDLVIAFIQEVFMIKWPNTYVVALVTYNEFPFQVEFIIADPVASLT